MINRIYFISQSIAAPGIELPVADDIYYFVMINPAVPEDFNRAYNLLEYGELQPIGVALKIHEPLTDGTKRFVTSFLFIPGYLRSGYKKIVNLIGDFSDQLTKAKDELMSYFNEQGMGEEDIIINTILVTDAEYSVSMPRLIKSDESLNYYTTILKTEKYYNNNFFILLDSPAELASTLASLRLAENRFEEYTPQLFSLAVQNRKLEQKISLLEWQNVLTEAELSYKQQHIDSLRSSHAARELQEYYNNEYEILPRWYKRLGHILKVIIGKRTFQSLYRDNVKKYRR